MMTIQHHQATFRVPLTEAYHRAAQDFYQRHAQPQKRKQVYLNTLSVQAVKFYLTCLGIETHLEKGESWNPVLQVLADIADLWVSNLGRLECRPVLPEQSDWRVPVEVWSERIGYLFVQVDTALTEADILGFLPQLDGEIVTLNQLQSLDDFPAYLDQLHHKQSVSSAEVRLRRWLAQVIDDGWTSLEALIAEWRERDLAFNFRIPRPKAELIEPATTGVKQGKFLTLGQESEEQILFIVGIAPVQDSVAFKITVELYPARNQAYLPPYLHLIVMDETNTPVLQAEGRQSEGLEFQFSGEPGERFSVQINLNQLTMTEQFEI